jgi:hypothetical protein
VQRHAHKNIEDTGEMEEEKTTKKSKGIFGGGKKSSKSSADSGRNAEADIKKLTRTELLELLIDETKEADRLRAENERLS